MMRLIRAVLFTLLVSLPLWLAVAPVHAVTVSVAPPETTVTVGDDFALRAVTTDFPDLKGYQLIYSFNSARITSQGVNPGDVLTSSGNPFRAFPQPDNSLPTGTITYDAAMLIGTTHGPGILGFLKFHAQSAGDTWVQCVLVDFRDPLNNQTLPTCVSGLVHVIAPVPALPTTWGRIKTLYR